MGIIVQSPVRARVTFEIRLICAELFLNTRTWKRGPDAFRRKYKALPTLTSKVGRYYSGRLVAREQNLRSCAGLVTDMILITYSMYVRMNV